MIILNPFGDSRKVSIVDGDRRIEAVFVDGECEIDDKDAKILMKAIPSIEEKKAKKSPKKKEQPEQEDGE